VSKLTVTIVRMAFAPAQKRLASGREITSIRSVTNKNNTVEI
jgi:hypothetical protein